MASTTPCVTCKTCGFHTRRAWKAERGGFGDCPNCGEANFGIRYTESQTQTNNWTNEPVVEIFGATETNDVEWDDTEKVLYDDGKFKLVRIGRNTHDVLVDGHLYEFLDYDEEDEVSRLEVLEDFGDLVKEYE